jgi:DinB superfamily
MIPVMANVGRPDPAEYASFYANYVKNVTEDDVVAALEAQTRETAALLARVDEEKAAYRYAPEKWSVKQIVGHVTDGERVFAYRALAIARGDQASLPGFDENDYMSNANFDRRSLRELAEDYAVARQATLSMFRGFSDEAWQRRGTANDSAITVRAIAHIVLGHERHHLKVLRERYGVS